MRLYSLLKRLVYGRPPTRPPCRLNEADAIAIATAAIGRAGLQVFDVKEASDGPRWIIGTPTFGSGETVVVDDRTGIVIEVSHWGVR